MRSQLSKPEYDLFISYKRKMRAGRIDRGNPAQVRLASGAMETPTGFGPASGGRRRSPSGFARRGRCWWSGRGG